MNRNANPKLLVVQVAALGYDFLCRHQGPDWDGLLFRPMKTVFPALTCPVQASFRTASVPGQHGMIANGLLHRRLMKPLFWEQSCRQVEGERIWARFRDAGRSVAMLFWQQSLGEQVDWILSPAPIHKHHGGMIQDCYGQPSGLYARLCRSVGRPFDLKRYWGPMASSASSQWIAEATCALLEGEDGSPDLCLTYLPVLDYDLQRYGTQHPCSSKALEKLLAQLNLLRAAAERRGYELLVFGDYAMGDCRHGPVYPNRALREAGLLQCREVRGRAYADLHTSRAFAVADHEIAHVYLNAASDAAAVKSVLAELQGVECVVDEAEQKERGLCHANSGELVVMAEDGHWIAYPWWNSAREAPDYASHVDIHSKPGYDPCELFFGWPPGSVSRDAGRIRGSHGRVGPGREACMASTFLDGGCESVEDLASSVQTWLGRSL